MWLDKVVEAIFCMKRGQDYLKLVLEMIVWFLIISLTVSKIETFMHKQLPSYIYTNELNAEP
jgi:hypothetical protein